VRQHIAEPLDLGRLLLADRDRLVPPTPELLAPADQPAGLAGHVRVEVTHEERELARRFNAQKEMKVVRSEGKGTDANAVELLRPAESAEDQLVELVAGGEEIAALDGPAGDLDEAAPLGRYVAYASSHSERGRRNSGDLAGNLELSPQQRFRSRK
jgi:hypothetical protein